MPPAAPQQKKAPVTAGNTAKKESSSSKSRSNKDSAADGRRKSNWSDSGSVSSKGSDSSQRSSKEPASPVSPAPTTPAKRMSVRIPKGSAAENPVEKKIAVDPTKQTEEEIFLRILDLLEQNDEFNSTSDDDQASDYGDDDEAGGDRDYSDTESEADNESEADAGEFERPLADWELESAWMELQERRIPSIDICKRMIRAIIALYKNEKNLVMVPKPDAGARLIVVGDLHGHFGDLMHILTEHGEPQLGPGGVKYVFNGDFVDRGAWGPEVLLCIYCLKLRCPQGVFLNRGNHEDQQQNLKPDNGFVHSHCTRAFGQDAQRVYALCRQSFKEIPLCHVIAKEIAVIHGGLPVDPLITFADINAIDRKRTIPVHHCSLLGYPRFQAVKAKRDLESENGEKVLRGSLGKLIERVGKTQQAVVRFSGGGTHEEAVVRIAGAPELEEDVDIHYESAKEREKHRSNRLFVSLLWSDPVSGRSQAGPSKRGAGCYFDERITQEFLRINKLSLMLRSHEKRMGGYQEEHRSTKNGLLAATVFSASNYPGGAGEPNGNQAAVVVFSCPGEGETLSSTLYSPSPWRKPYEDGAYDGFRMSEEMRAKFQKVEEARVLTVGSRARALAKLREMVYVARPKLLSFWQRVDSAGVGLVPLEAWAKGMRACVVPDDDFPWEWLAPFMLKQRSSKKQYNYAAYLAQYENSLSRKLADQWHGGAVLSLAKGVNTRAEAETAWAKIDRNRDGRLSYQELRPLLRSAMVSDATTEEDRVYSVLARIDKDRTGYVDREEFLSAVERCLDSTSLLEEAKNDAADELVHTQSKKLVGTERRSELLKQELAKWSEKDIAQCWAATQGAIRALAATTGCASSVFEVLDGDNDGVIDRSEFQQGIMQLLRGSQLLRSFDQWEPLLWKLVDEDFSGQVSPEELNLAFSVREFLSI
eukprot:TRINITY_DN44287_c0_g1_i1.p1 TRINITY_DN44287_c0_g1~~TRINITY_DN44287_c0_g1_i1.p1  ORF type:complete len:950 (-),score=149.86 TRINITY_DN44287_c0_g1_i1:54-2843(-)